MRNDEREINKTSELECMRSELRRTKKELKRLKKLCAELEDQKEELRHEKEIVELAYARIAHSEVWRLTKPIRIVIDIIKWIVKKIPPLRLLAKFIRSLSRNGLRATWHKIKLYRSMKKRLHRAKKIDLSRISAKQRALEEATVFEKEILFSILVPLYNTPVSFLQEMIASVQGQTYSKWELCLADGSDAEHDDVGKTVLHLAQKDPRIKYQKLEKNLGISENTNACIKMSTGDFIALFDHDDVLHPSALFEMMKAICEQDADFVYTDEATFESPDIKKIITFHYKPNFAIDNLRANNYICHFSAFSRKVLEQTGLFRPAYDGSQDHDMILRLTSKAKKIVHVPKLLYFWRSHPMSVAMDINSKTYAIEAGKRAVLDSIRQAGMDAEVESSKAFPTIYRIRYKLKADAAKKVSIIIPNKNHEKTLRSCIQSILKKTTYTNYEIIIVDNGSDQKSLFKYYEELKEYPNIKILQYNKPFNYSAINNFAVQHASGEYLLFLNNDIQIITHQWIEELMMYVQRDDVGAAGAMLYYPDNTVQHAGIILKLGYHRIAGHAFHQYPRGGIGYMGRNCYAQNMSAVTAACMMVKTSLYTEIGGFDETYPVAFNDVDLCLRIRAKGKLIVWTPFAEAYHFESKSRGKDDKTDESKARFKADCKRFRERWGKVLEAGDPYYNPNFSLDTSSFDLM